MLFGTYILMGIIFIFAVAVIGLIIMLMLASQKDKAVEQNNAAKPREDTLADVIQKQFQANDARKERIIYNKTGISKAKMKETRSAFTFETADDDNNLTLESRFADDDAKEPFIDTPKNNNL
jgi:uncharacterized membrane protein